MSSINEGVINNCVTNTEKVSNGASLFSKAVCAYMLGGLVGTIWETILNFCVGKGFVYCNGSIFTPFNFVYGFGALVIVLCLHNQTKVWKAYIIGALGGGMVEYVLNFLEEKLVGTRTWNYSDKFLNINGRTTIPFMLFWGFLAVGVLFLVYKPLSKKLDKLPQKPLKIFSIVCCTLIIIDLFITTGAIYRYSQRLMGNEPLLYIGRALDSLFDNEFMHLHFPGMKIV